MSTEKPRLHITLEVNSSYNFAKSFVMIAAEEFSRVEFIKVIPRVSTKLLSKFYPSSSKDMGSSLYYALVVN